MNTTTKTYGAPLKFKADAVAPSGVFTAYAAAFGNLDGNGDIIDCGAFTKTLQEAASRKTSRGGPLFPVLWQHQDKEPIGYLTHAAEDSRGLLVNGQLDLDTDLGHRAHSAMTKGYIRAMSIGFIPVKDAWDTKRRHHITEIALFEVSPVTFPANEEAKILDVKSQSDDLEAFEAFRQLLDEMRPTDDEAAALLATLEQQSFELLLKRLRP